MCGPGPGHVTSADPSDSTGSPVLQHIWLFVLSLWGAFILTWYGPPRRQMDSVRWHLVGPIREEHTSCSPLALVPSGLERLLCSTVTRRACKEGFGSLSIWQCLPEPRLAGIFFVGKLKFQAR